MTDLTGPYYFTSVPSENEFSSSFGKINNPADGGVSHVLRREGDSNPRYGYPYGSLANCWFKPLTHRSKKRLPYTAGLLGIRP